MHGGQALPRVGEDMRLREVMLEIMQKRLGIAGVVDAEGRLSGVISDGDFKRILLRESDPWRLTAAEIMSRTPSTPDTVLPTSSSRRRRHRSRDRLARSRLSPGRRSRTLRSSLRPKRWRRWAAISRTTI